MDSKDLDKEKLPNNALLNLHLRRNLVIILSSLILRQRSERTKRDHSG